MSNKNMEDLSNFSCPVLLPAETIAGSCSKQPSASVKPLNGLPTSTSKIPPPRSRLPTFRQNNSLMDTSNLHTPNSSMASNVIKSSSQSEEVFADENQQPSSSVLDTAPKYVQFSSNMKRKCVGENETSLSKRAKPDHNRVGALKNPIAKKAARRSLSNALKISRNKAAKEAAAKSTAKPLPKVQPSLRKPLVPSAKKVNSQPATKKTQRNTGTRNSSTVSNSLSRTKAPTGADKFAKKSAPESKLPSRSSTSSRSSGERKPKRKPWDLRGQLEDMEEALNAEKQKAKDIPSILSRLDALEKENKTIAVEKTDLSVNNEKWQQKIAELEVNLRQKVLDFEDLQQQNRKLQRSRDELDLEVRQLRRDNIEVTDRCADAEKTCKERGDKILNLERTLRVTEERVVCLESDKREVEAHRRQLLNDVQELKGNIRVFCRVRPILQSELEEVGSVEHIHYTGKSGKSIAITNQDNKLLNYTFDAVFNADASQEKVFEEVCQLVQSALDGYNVCIFAYGQTGAGKTYTMEGPENAETKDDGIIPRSMRLIFQKCEEKKQFGWSYELSVQHVEIYRETLKDLLVSKSDPAAKLEIKTVTKPGKNQSVWVKNLSEHKIDNFNQVRALLNQAKKNRATAATNANDRSSRSHSVFILKMKAHNAETGEDIESGLNLIDLAGSERVGETGSSGTRLKEAQKINGSLCELSNVISALANKEKHVPFRNSKLTFLLSDSLGGNSKTLMLVNVNPNPRATSETANTLRFATTVNKCHIGTAQKVVKFA